MFRLLTLATLVLFIGAGCAASSQPPMMGEPDASPGIVSEDGTLTTPVPAPPAPQAAPSDEVVLVENVDVSGEDPVFFSFRDGALVQTFYESDDWDVAFEGTAIYFNGEAQLVPLAFDDVRDAPTDGFRRDDRSEPVVPTGSGQGWYRYDPAKHKVRALPERTMLFRAPTGELVKLEILSYYRDGADPASETDTPRFFSFRYQRSLADSLRF